MGNRDGVRVPTGWPVDPAVATVTAGFGAPRGSSRHQGIDLAAPAGTPVRATADGWVVVAERQKRYGRTVVLDHGDGYRTRYAHLKRIDTKKGKKVRRGDVIGRVGQSGNASGTHLHYEVLRNGVPLNPRPYLD
jgi:murein DD-endopeptidase MepM/ murein hydrolase activator NlpD